MITPSAVSHRHSVQLRGWVDAEFLADMGEGRRIGEAGIAIIVRNATRPGLVKISRGQRWVVSICISPRSTSPWAGNGSFGWPARGPPRQVLS